jgi:hypothetical protein
MNCIEFRLLVRQVRRVHCYAFEFYEEGYKARQGSRACEYLFHRDTFTPDQNEFGPALHDAWEDKNKPNFKCRRVYIGSARYCPCCRRLWTNYNSMNKLESRRWNKLTDLSYASNYRTAPDWGVISALADECSGVHPFLYKRCGCHNKNLLSNDGISRCSIFDEFGFIRRSQAARKRLHKLTHWGMDFTWHDGFGQDRPYLYEKFKDVYELKRWIHYGAPKDSRAVVFQKAIKKVRNRILRRGISDSARQFFELHFGVAKFAALLRQTAHTT